MTIQLNAQQEQVITQAIKAGLIHSPEEVVEVGVETIRQQLDAILTEGNIVSAEEWSREFHAWVHGHPTDTVLLPDEALSRESIYGMRGR